MPGITLASIFGILVSPNIASAAEAGPLDLPLWTAGPFVLLLLAIAILPLFAGHFWHRNFNKALVAAACAVPVAVYLFILSKDNPTASDSLLHAVEEYASFIILLGSLYVVSGGILLTGDIQARPLANTAILAGGAILANLIGTTGASMLLIRPVLRINQERQRTSHLPIFFIFTVSNLGGLLTPLGDPPLFLGFLRGVDFFWTFSLWKEWLVANGVVLTIFLIWDSIAYIREPRQAIALDKTIFEPIRVKGLINLFFLAGIVAAVLFQSDKLLGEKFTLHKPWGELLMIAMALASLFLTPAKLRTTNKFSCGPIVEVAVLFAGIFIAMVPALEILKVRGGQLGVTEPWQFFWATGMLSGFLDNAPTYVSFATLASRSDDFSVLVREAPLILAAISCGAVFMGANTYIGNGPNFMVKAIADEAGVRMPSFFGYMLYSGLILLPTFGLITYLFFLGT